jgi:hypothetical protein
VLVNPIIEYSIRVTQHLIECRIITIFTLKHVSTNLCGHHKEFIKYVMEFYFWEDFLPFTKSGNNVLLLLLLQIMK